MHKNSLPSIKVYFGVYHKRTLKTTSRAEKTQKLHKKTPAALSETTLRRLPIKAWFAIVFAKRAPDKRSGAAGG